MIRIAIQAKGRLNEDSVELLREAGISLEENKRKLLTKSADFPIEVLYLRDDDIPHSVAMGVADIGIVGLNEVEETGQKVDIVHKLGFGKCRISLAIPKGESYDSPSYFNGKKVATSYPNILQQYFSKRAITAEVHNITGSVEIAPAVGMADAIFDIVSSGSTLVSNQLKEVEVLMQSEALLIANNDLSAEKLAILDELLFRFEAIQEAEGKKYVLLNAPKEKMKEIIEVLPGMKSPTITPLANENWVSVQSVIAEKHFWEIIGKLKLLGAEGILVIPIEKMIL